ncbi:MAG: leucine-rich repeat domain-containing protein [Promethearchaeota archaeon]
MSLICPKCGKKYKSPSFYQKHVEKCTDRDISAKPTKKTKVLTKNKPKNKVEKEELTSLKNQMKKLETRVSKLEMIIKNAYLDAYEKPSEIENKEIVNYHGVSLFHQDYEFLIDLESKIGEIPIVSNISWNSFGFKTENMRILGLSIYNMNINSIPDSIGSLFSLKELHLDSNMLSTLPQSIENLKSLKILNLGHNKFKTIPKCILTLSSLEELTLWSNNIISIPESIGNLKMLKKLYLFDNNIKSIPNEIGGLKSLKILDLKKNKLENLPDSITKLKSLKKLLIKSNQFTPLSEDINNWLKDLEENGCKIFR